MSMPTYDLICSRCDYQSSSMVTWGRFVYEDGNSAFPCKHQLGWCENCAGFVPMEAFDASDQEFQEIESSHDWLRRYSDSAWQHFLNWLIPSRRKWLTRQHDRLEGAIKVMKLSMKRKGTERCLDCGSRNVVPFRGNIGVTLADNFVFAGSSNTGFIHPHCGGEFIAKGSGTRYLVRFTTRRYDTEGERI